MVESRFEKNEEDYTWRPKPRGFHPTEQIKKLSEESTREADEIAKKAKVEKDRGQKVDVSKYSISQRELQGNQTSDQVPLKETQQLKDGEEHPMFKTLRRIKNDIKAESENQ